MVVFNTGKVKLDFWSVSKCNQHTMLYLFYIINNSAAFSMMHLSVSQYFFFFSLKTGFGCVNTSVFHFAL